MCNEERMSRFLNHFKFSPHHPGSIRITRDVHLLDSQGICVPRAVEFLEQAKDARYGLSRLPCMVKDTTRPQQDLREIWNQLIWNDTTTAFNGNVFGIQARTTDVSIEIFARDLEQALAISNSLVEGFDELVALGGHPKILAYAQRPVRFESLKHFYGFACATGFVDDPRICTSLIRITTETSIECRLFSQPRTLDDILIWAAAIQKLAVP